MYPCHAPITPPKNLVKKKKDQVKEECSCGFTEVTGAILFLHCRKGKLLTVVSANFSFGLGGGKGNLTFMCVVNKGLKMHRTHKTFVWICVDGVTCPSNEINVGHFRQLPQLFALVQ